MPSASRKAQLGLGREIVSKCHADTQPANQHLDFIQRRLEELDSEGFIWSKDSMLSIFLQLGLSETPPSFFSSVNNIIESRVCQGLEVSSDEVKDMIQSEELLHTARPLGLMDLPTEVFDKILETLDCIATLEARDIHAERSKGMVSITGPGEQEPYRTYLHRNPPILNTIQTFSLTSRKIHHLCRPWLWRKLRFPTSLPAPMDLWTEDILLRQGSYVQSLSITLSPNCSKPLDETVQHDSFYDNLIPGDYKVEDVSPKNVRELINRCPNLSTLDIKYDYHEAPEDAGGTETFLLGLIPLLSSLKQLRHLAVQGRYKQKNMNAFPTDVVASLPLLESFDFAGLAAYAGQPKLGDGSFGLNLSKLKFLSRLHLWFIDDIDANWCLYSWPRTITELTIHQCDNLLPSSANQIIHHIAPYLTKLRLEFGNKQGDDSWETDPSWSPQSCFSLPFLIDLALTTRNADLLYGFQDCKSLSCLEWNYRTSTQFRTLETIVSKNTWPQLRKLVVIPYRSFILPSNLDPRYQEIRYQVISLQKYCKVANMTVTTELPYLFSF
ncbi:uncharacterized protein MELLADRAFT_113310 [Melampsora larici-populina 98AG31]|uniref:F-box domain-containing protein n=1 Tax=Melampsora larici-populina (strain 98AG31 / pathotype 3-4-7) TaxID=747676 RepID=F4S9G0_MELLP|nr:uncharacterized protein MELLADRAFT_113310 [Melampsora larici-populina 98AG31]EGF98716.1 hypothetical protein MELLADRAFT_113310 [Melampsora larici-populina 98AG31]